MHSAIQRSAMTCSTIRSTLRTSGCSTVTSLRACEISLGHPVLTIAKPCLADLGFERWYLFRNELSSSYYVENASFVAIEECGPRLYASRRSVMIEGWLSQNLRIVCASRELMLTITGYCWIGSRVYECGNERCGKDNGGGADLTERC